MSLSPKEDQYAIMQFEEQRRHKRKIMNSVGPVEQYQVITQT